MTAADCPLCLMRRDGDTRTPGETIMMVKGSDLCPRCLEHMIAIRTIAERCDFNAIEAANFVDALPVGGSGNILAATAFKMARSWGEAKAREILLLKLDQALEAIRATPVDA